MLHEWWGFNDSTVKTAEIFAQENISVFVPDLYRGQPAIDHEEAGHKLSGLDWPASLNDIKHIKEHFEPLAKSVSVIGFCMGGALAIAALTTIEGFKCGFPFYGIPDTSNFKLGNIKAKVLANFGEKDPLAGFSDLEAAKKL